MSRKRCVRKHWALVDPIAHAIVGASIASEARLDRLRIKELSAIEAFSKGKATPGDFRDICDLLNVTETLGEMGIGPEALEWCEKVQNALLRVKDQYEKHGCMTLRAEELMAMRELYAYQDAQRTSIGLSVYEQAIQKTVNKIKGKAPNVRVLV